MFKRTIVMVGAALALASTLAKAESFFQVEVGLGRSTYRDQGNQIWYQEGMPYKLSLKPPAFLAGFRGDILERANWGLSWHVDYEYLGTVHTDAIATTDENYDPQTKACRTDPCAAQTRFTGHGNVSGIALTLEPHYDWNGFRLGVEGGPFVFLPSWTESLTPATPVAGVGATTVHAPAKLHVGAVVGVSVGYKNFSLSFQHFFDKVSTEFTPVWSSTNVVMARYRF
jgi:hypothetical protein